MILPGLIHMTATYSNAVLVAMLPHVSEFSQKLDLPIMQPITTNQVFSSVPSRLKDEIEGSVILTNGYWFRFSQLGFVSGFRSPRNIFYQLDPSNVEAVSKFVGQANITTNQAAELARKAIQKLGCKLEYFGAQEAPSHFEGPFQTKQGVVPFCSMYWELPGNELNRLEVQIDMQTKTLVGLYYGFSADFARSNHIGTPLSVDVIPELEEDYQKRISGKIFYRTNASTLPKTVPNK